MGERKGDVIDQGGWSPGFAVKLPGTMEVRGESEEIRECWKLLMNTLG